MTTTYRLHFPDGTSVRGDSPHGLLAKLGDLQWEPVDPEEMKDLLSDRAWAWNHSLLDPELADEAFLAALHDTGMVKLTIDTTDDAL